MLLLRSTTPYLSFKLSVLMLSYCTRRELVVEPRTVAGNREKPGE